MLAIYETLWTVRLQFILFLIVGVIVSPPVQCCLTDDTVQQTIIERWQNMTDSSRAVVVKTNFAILLQDMELSRSAKSVHLVAQSVIKIHDHRYSMIELEPCSEDVELKHLTNFSIDVGVYNGENFRSKTKLIKFIVNGTIIISERIEVDIPCSSHSLDYPFGSVLCVAYFYNKSNGSKIIELNWDESHKQHPFINELSIVHVNDMILTYFGFPQIKATEAHDGIAKLVMELDFVPDLNKVIFMFYFPSGLIVFICWLSFLLGPLINVRAIMNIGSLLLLYLHYASNIANMPETYGISTIAVWEITMIIFVTAAVVELVTVSFMGSFGRSKRLSRSWRKNRLQRCRYDMEPLYEELNDYRNGNENTCRCCRYCALSVDLIALFAYGATFIIFTLYYFNRHEHITLFLNGFK